MRWEPSRPFGVRWCVGSPLGPSRCVGALEPHSALWGFGGGAAFRALSPLTTGCGGNRALSPLTTGWEGNRAPSPRTTGCWGRTGSLPPILHFLLLRLLFLLQLLLAAAFLHFGLTGREESLRCKGVESKNKNKPEGGNTRH